MSQELAYVLINPYTLMKSRTGGVIARLLGRSNLELVACRMFAPSKELVEEFCGVIEKDSRSRDKIKSHIISYLQNNYIKHAKSKMHNRVMFLLFKGENAVEKIRKVVGPLVHRSISGETIRDTYGDYIKDAKGNIAYFEPAVLVPPDAENAEKRLKIWAKHSKKCGGVLEKAINYKNKKNVQKTLVLIKPDNFRGPSHKAGNIIDLFSRTGLYIIGAKLISLSLKEAEEFYGPVRKVLAEKLQSRIKERIKKAIESEFGFKVPDACLDKVTRKTSNINAENEFNNIVYFMTGIDRKNPEVFKNKHRKSRVKCLALVYQGKDAVQKIRNQLGATDPTKAEWATVRREFGQNVMENTAHASDSPFNAEREMRIIKMGKDDIEQIVRDFYGEKKK
ncbi:MAG: nucleoside-diphosphate kinase [bacterium]|nr:nucleoside-diphosphate kinase [bacterium]